MCTFIFFRPTWVSAADFESNYQVEYFLQQGKNGLSSKARFTITITNTASDVYVSKFSLAFPSSFSIAHVQAADDKGTVVPIINTTGQKTNIQLAFTDPAMGKGSTNHFYLLFDQNNLFKERGNIWEVMLPTFEDPSRNSYDIIVHLPNHTNKKLSIAKPKPDSIQGDTITWHNPTTKTVYAVFGDTQYYHLLLTYHLQNPQIAPVYTEIAFPPDTTYQQVFSNHISPPPAEVYRDEDGNFLGKYFLKPKENLDVTFDGTAVLSVEPRPEVASYVRSTIPTQEHYLLTDTPYWHINNLSEISSLETPESIFNFDTSKLTYNYSRLNTTSNTRYGASGILQHPDQAVCIDYTDLFVGIAREKGIYAREIEGYGYSEDPQLRPLSLISDVLHSWPEYYDVRSQLWIPIDPTWESTSGIDYFHSFDLNHITFAIHGKKTDYPVPAGMYKTENSKDISVQPIANPDNEQDLLKAEVDMPSHIADNVTQTGFITVQNRGNTYRWNIPIEVQSADLILGQSDYTIPVLAPYEIAKLPLSIQAKHATFSTQAHIAITSAQKPIGSKDIQIVAFLWSIILSYFAPAAGILLIIFIISRIRNRPN